MNLLVSADSYKAGHSRLYPPGLTNLYSYVEAREGGKFPATIFFGLQYYLLKYLEGKVFTFKDIYEAKSFWENHFGRKDYFDSNQWNKLWTKHGGILPLRIKAVPEGSLVGAGNVLMTIENTDDEFPWLTNWFETLLLKIWYPCTVATQSYYIRKKIKEVYEATGADLAALDFACHDFGYRGVSSEETAALGGASHLLSFNGTDTVAGILMLQKYYNATMCGFSIPATEHSIICAFGPEHELEAYQHLLNTLSTGTIACVSDTYDLYHAIDRLWGGKLYDDLSNREGRLVIRPDSGEPNQVIPVVLSMLSGTFGSTWNDKDYAVLNEKIRVIQGDGMTYETICALYDTLKICMWSADNLVVGSGGGLLQKVDRDTLRFAWKASEVTIDGETQGIYKKPVTDPTKKSRAGRFKLARVSDTRYITLGDESSAYKAWTDELETVFEDGVVTKKYSLDEIRERVRNV